MNNEPLFSVLVANYNNASYIAKAIQSVKEQTYKNWEIIVVDDASTDDSLQVLKDFLDDQQLFVHENKVNRGCGFTKSVCVKKANGIIGGFLDPDDALAPEALQLMVEAHINSPKLALVSSSHFICSSNLKIEREAYGAGGIPLGESYLSYGKGITHFSSFKLEYYRKTEGINESYKRAVDQDLYYKLEEVGGVDYIHKPLYYYRIHEKGISTHKNLSKSRYWFVKAKKAAYFRRKNNQKAKNISYSEIKSWESIYLITKASDKLSNSKFISGLGYLFKGFSKSLIDKYFILKVKTIFLNTAIHRFIQKIRRK